MNDYKTLLKNHPNGTLSTLDKGKPAARIFQILWIEENRIYFCTSNKKEVYAQIKVNPEICFSSWDPSSFACVSVNGKANFVDCIECKKRALEENPPIKGIYGSPENPEFEIFYLDIHTVKTFNFPEGTKTIAL